MRAREVPFAVLAIILLAATKLRGLRETGAMFAVPVYAFLGHREINRPVVDYVTRLRDQAPRDVVTVYIPEYVVGHWWEQVLHNQSALRLKTRLLYERGVMVTSVPWQLSSSDGRAEQARDEPVVGRWGGPEER